MIPTSRPSTKIFERKRMRWVGQRRLMEIEKTIGLERSCRKAEEKIQHRRFSSSSEFIMERNMNLQA